MNKNQVLPYLLAIAALLCGSIASAQSTLPLVRTGTLPTFFPTEYRGGNAWFDPAYDGQGWSFSEIDAGPGGVNTGIGVSYTYAASGAPTWLLLQGAWQRQSTVLSILNGGPVAVLSGPIFEGSGGSCPTCSPIAPSISQPVYQNAEITFVRPDIATVKLDGVTALSGEGALVPAELVLTRSLPDILVGRWRFTVRFGQISSTYQELNYDTHGCELNISRVPSPTTLNRFEADPASVPFWLPPSGDQVQWLRVDDGLGCAPPPRFDDRFHIAYEPSSISQVRAISLNSATPGPGTPPIGGTPSYTVSRGSRFFEIYVQSPNSLIIRRFQNNDPNQLRLIAEHLLTRAP